MAHDSPLARRLVERATTPAGVALQRAASQGARGAHADLHLGLATELRNRYLGLDPDAIDGTSAMPMAIAPGTTAGAAPVAIDGPMTPRISPSIVTGDTRESAAGNTVHVAPELFRPQHDDHLLRERVRSADRPSEAAPERTSINLAAPPAIARAPVARVKAAGTFVMPRATEAPPMEFHAVPPDVPATRRDEPLHVASAEAPIGSAPESTIERAARESAAPDRNHPQAAQRRTANSPVVQRHPHGGAMQPPLVAVRMPAVIQRQASRTPADTTVDAATADRTTAAAAPAREAISREATLPPLLLQRSPGNGNWGRESFNEDSGQVSRARPHPAALLRTTELPAATTPAPATSPAAMMPVTSEAPIALAPAASLQRQIDHARGIPLTLTPARSAPPLVARTLAPAGSATTTPAVPSASASLSTASPSAVTFPSVAASPSAAGAASPAAGGEPERSMVDRITRQLLRELTIERERRGGRRWP